MTITQQTPKQKLAANLKHLDAMSKEAFRAAGRSLRSGVKPRVRIVYAPKSSRRQKRKVMSMVGRNEYCGLIHSIKYNKSGGLTMLVADYAREEIGRKGPVMTHMTLDRVSNVVLLGCKEDEPR